ncbi:MAG: aminotransferase class V-fold PLP-dependent enzyme [Balneola sp.]|nr:MAG: aminotransferase class V-fold PLP-dependent enzyme [Balneola sp.]
MASRKDFLTQVAAGGAASLLSTLTPIKELFTEQMGASILPGQLPTRKDYSLSDSVTYLNHGSTGTMPKIVQEARRSYLALCENNPWFYMWSSEWEEPIHEVREKVARYINANPNEITFPHNTTEIFNLLALGLRLGSGDEVLFPNLNHSGASIPFHFHASKKGYDVRVFEMPVERISDINVDDLLALYDEHITPKTRLVVIPHIDNTFGVRQPAKEITKLARSKGVPFVALDTAQTMGMIPIDVKDLDVDIIGTSAHKWLQAPKGISVAYFNPRIWEEVSPMWVTWGQERWKGSSRVFEDYGTRNRPEILSIGHAIDFQASLDEEVKSEKLQSLWNLAKDLADEHPNTTWRSPRTWELSGSLFVIEVNSIKPSELSNGLFLDHGIVFRPFDGYSTIRISPNLANTEEEISRLFELI